MTPRIGLNSILPKEQCSRVSRHSCIAMLYRWHTQQNCTRGCYFLTLWLYRVASQSSVAVDKWHHSSLFHFSHWGTHYKVLTNPENFLSYKSSLGSSPLLPLTFPFNSKVTERRCQSTWSAALIFASLHLNYSRMPLLGQRNENGKHGPARQWVRKTKFQ